MTLTFVLFDLSMTLQSSYIAALQARKILDAPTTSKRYLTLEDVNESTPHVT